MFHQATFGYLEADSGSVETGLIELLGNSIRPFEVGQGVDGEVDRNVQVESLAAQAGRVIERLLANVIGQGADQVVLLGHRNKRIGPNQTHCRMVPAGQRFDTDHLPGFDIDLGLKKGIQLVFFDGPLELVEAKRIDQHHRALGAYLIQRIKQFTELDRRHRFFEHAEHLQFMLDGKLFHGFQYPNVFTAGQDQRTTVIFTRQVTDQLDPVHPGHVQVADNHVDIPAFALEVIECLGPGHRVHHPGHAEIVQHHRGHPVHDVIIVDQQQLDAELGNIFAVAGNLHRGLGDIDRVVRVLLRGLEVGSEELFHLARNPLQPGYQFFNFMPVGFARRFFQHLAGERQRHRPHAARRRLELVGVLGNLLFALPGKSLADLRDRPGQRLQVRMEQLLVQFDLVSGRLSQHGKVDRIVPRRQIDRSLVIFRRQFSLHLRGPFFQRATQVLELHRFRDDMVHAHIEALLDVRFERVGGDGDDCGSRFTALLELPDFAHQVVAIHFRHANVGQKQVVATLLPTRQRALPIFRVICPVTENTELRRHQLLVDQVVLGDQDARKTNIGSFALLPVPRAGDA